jgi:uncharacterized RDD family membrane protein YckC
MAAPKHPDHDLKPMDLDISQARTPGLLRRLAALLYDGVLLFGILLLAAGLVIVPYMSLIAGDFPSTAWWFRAWLAAVVAGFYTYFWTHGGQTLGMSAWRLRLVRDDGGKPRLADALLRLACAAVSLAPAGLGLLWVLIDRDGLAWHDRWSRTRLVLVARK